MNHLPAVPPTLVPPPSVIPASPTSTFLASLNQIPWDIWAAPSAIVLSAFTASVLAYLTINANKKLKKKSETMTFIMQRSRDEVFQKSFAVIRNIDKDNNRDIRFFAEKQKFNEEIATANGAKEKNEIKEVQKEHDEGIICLNYLLNQYEYMAVGVKQGIYDEDMLINSSKTSTVKSFEITEKLIIALRGDDGKSKHAYEEFEALAKRWKGID